MVVHGHDAVDPVSTASHRPFSWRRDALSPVVCAAAGSLVNFFLSHGDSATTVAFGGTYLFLAGVVTTGRVIWRRARPRQ